MHARLHAIRQALNQRFEAVLVGDRDALADLYVTLALTISLTSGALSPSPWITRFNAACAPMVVLLMWARKRGYISRAVLTWTTLLLVNVIVTASVWVFGGVASIAMAWYLVLPLPVMMVLGMRSLLPTFALIGLSIGVTLYMQEGGWLPTLPSPGSNLLWPITTFTMMALTILSLPIVAYVSLQRILGLLRDRNRELRNTQAVLLTQKKQQEEFVASVSHELRTPMNAIVGFLQAIDKPRMASARNRDMLDAMNHSARHLLTVINDLLDFSQIQVGNLRVTSRPMALRELLNDVTTMFESQLNERGIRMVAEVEASLPEWAQGDADRLTQVIINLLGNAAKFTRQGSVTLRAMRTESGSLRIEVADTGCGIAPEQLDAVFDRFSQITDNTRREYGGTGLGLSISQNLIRLMGGTIGVESTLDVGSTFWFELPLAPAQAPNPPIETQATSAAPTPDLSGQVLIVDDSPINRVVARQMLARDLPHLTIVEASSGAQALEIVLAGSVDLVLMDVIMPEMDGIETTRRILAIPQPPPVIGLTADITETVRAGCLGAGMRAVLTKPYARAVLVDLVVKTLLASREAP